MSKLQKISFDFENKHSNGDIFIRVNGGQCYLIIGPCQTERFLYIDEDGHVYNEYNKPCCTQTNKLDILERKIKELQDEVNCIRRGD